jgi:aspartate aminotransferase
LLLALGYAFPTVVLQRALADLDRLTIDIPHLQEKRDRMVGALRGMGYELAVPAGDLLPASSITANDEMIDRALPWFQAAMSEAEAARRSQARVRS